MGACRYVADVEGFDEPFVKTFEDDTIAERFFGNVMRTVFDEEHGLVLTADDGRKVILTKDTLKGSHVEAAEGE